MNEHILNLLEFPNIRERLAAYAATYLGKDLAMRLWPSGDFRQVQRQLDETSEACRIYAQSSPPLGGICDIRPQLDKVKRDGTLDTNELADILSTMLGMRAVKKFFKELVDVSADILKGQAQSIEILGQLERELALAIDEHGELRDDASFELRRIRRERRYKENSVKERISAIADKESNKKFFQDDFVTVRDGR